ncbi:hypothetical protein D6C91_05640 [Aureobasidium pullulans]|uniref:Uncharacterized protein n=1 Tax=Aureobasidium pullulans TaxID=5580 RepID=A0A4S9T382_AURPU|nr:hypothetical protein D6C91_05640 [Aureobasidium pullulans]
MQDQVRHTAIMNAPASFISLPSELVTKICRDSALEKKDLIALRYTSKTQGIHVSATQEFAKRYFEELRVMWTPYSFLTFCKICESPVFGPHVRTVKLSSIRIAVQDLWNILVQHRYRSYSSSTQDQIDLSTQRVEQHFRRYNMEIEMKKPAKSVDIFKKALSALQTYGNSLALAISTNEEGCIGANDTLTPLSIDETVDSSLWDITLEDSMEFLLEAASGTNLETKDLRIETCYFGGQLLAFSDNDSTESTALWAVCPGLLKLTIEANIAGDADDLVIDERLTMASLQELFSHATKLSSLKLAGNLFMDAPDQFRRTMEFVNASSLEEIVLHVDHATGDGILILLKKASKTLRHLDINAEEFTGSWVSVVCWIMDNLPELTYFRLLLLPDMTSTSFPGALELKGSYEIQSGLAKLLQEEKSTDEEAF